MIERQEPHAVAESRDGRSGVGPQSLEADPLDTLLAERFGLPEFKVWQREAIEALLRPGGRVLLVAPTGGGKSLCYQLPALALDGTALVLSPLISLMEDQVRALEGRGIAATFVASSLPREENGRRLAGVRRGDYKILYAAPERLAFSGFLEVLEACRLSLVAIDEAHCIVQWGHDFRPDYMRIGEAIEKLRPPRVLACTATATPDARDEILRQLRLATNDVSVILRGFARPNLHLSAHEVAGPADARRHVTTAIEAALGSTRKPAGAAIVYAATRKTTERLAEQLSRLGWKAAAYHAGLPAEVRAGVSARFADREAPIVVATNAFGMGIDRSDVRVVVHAQPPASIEAYYQEVGRAGRDGAPAKGILLVAAGDVALRRRMCTASADGTPSTPADAARAWGLFRELLRYVDAGMCRHDFILRYFGDEAESLGGCGHCDVCLDPDASAPAGPEERERESDIVRRALAGVARAKGGAGVQGIVAMLRGQPSEHVSRLGLDRLSTFGILRGHGQEELSAVMRVLLAAGWVDLTTTEFPVPVLTEQGWRVMRGDLGVTVRLARARDVTRAPRESRADSDEPGERKDRKQKANQVGETAVSGKKPRPTAREIAPGDASVFEALRAFRSALAKERDVPAYVIATDRTLIEIASSRPRSLEELRAVHGMGPARCAALGDELLRVVRESSS